MPPSCHVVRVFLPRGPEAGAPVMVLQVWPGPVARPLNGARTPSSIRGEIGFRCDVSLVVGQGLTYYRQPHHVDGAGRDLVEWLVRDASPMI